MLMLKRMRLAISIMTKISLKHELEATETACFRNKEVDDSQKMKCDKLKVEL